MIIPRSTKRQQERDLACQGHIFLHSINGDLFPPECMSLRCVDGIPVDAADFLQPLQKVDEESRVPAIGITHIVKMRKPE